MATTPAADDEDDSFLHHFPFVAKDDPWEDLGFSEDGEEEVERFDRADAAERAAVRSAVRERMRHSRTTRNEEMERAVTASLLDFLSEAAYLQAIANLPLIHFRDNGGATKPISEAVTTSIQRIETAVDRVCAVLPDYSAKLQLVVNGVILMQEQVADRIK